MSHVAAPLPLTAFRTPQSGFDYFVSERHCRAVAARILGALHGESAILVLTGEPAPRGSALAHALEAAAPPRYRTVAVSCTPYLNQDMLMEAAAAELAHPAAAVAGPLDAPLSSRSEGAIPLFLLDEAERLSDSQMSTVALLAELGVGAVVLLAPSGFADRFDAPPLIAAKTRLAGVFSFQELGRDEIEPFVHHQLSGEAGASAFPPEIIAAIAAAAGGDPKLVNILARLVLDYAARTGESLPRDLFARAFGKEAKSAASDTEEVPDGAAFLAAPAAGAMPVETVPRKPVEKRDASKLRLVVCAVGLAAVAALAGGGAILLRQGQPPAGAGAARPQQISLPSAEIATLLRRGDGFFATGDVASARLFYERAAAAGNARAALRLAQTYDPEFLRRAGVVGVLGDPRLARHWYRRAHALDGAEPMLKP